MPFVVDRVGQQDKVAVQVECRPTADDTSLIKEKLEHELKIATGLSIEPSPPLFILQRWRRL